MFKMKWWMWTLLVLGAIALIAFIVVRIFVSKLPAYI